MRILLTAVNTKYIHSNLAVYSLRAASGDYAPLIELAEYTINHRAEDIFRSVYKKKPQLLFLSCYIWNRNIMTELAENLRRVLPGIVIWAGGPEVSFDAEEFLEQFPQIDGVMCGEGERTFRRLLRYYVDGAGELEDIPGIAWRRSAKGDAGEICSTPQEPPMETLDELPFVYQSPEEFTHRIIYYESSRGCPFSCSYCLSSLDRSVRFRSAGLVEKELAVFLEHRVPQVKFVDRTFNCSHARTVRLWRFLKEHDNGITNFHFEITADLLNDEELELLSGMRPGLVQLEIGVQTVSRRALEAVRRTGEFAQIAEKAERILRAGNVHLHLDLIAGLPFEDFESFGRSFDAVYRLHPQELQLGFLKVLRGSEIHRRAEEYGILYCSEPPYEVLATKWISCDELIRLKEIEEMLEIYYNSGQFRSAMAFLEGLYGRPFELYEALADHDLEVRSFGEQYSRQQRFAFLRSFLERKAAAGSERAALDGDRSALSARFDELLTLDCYRRENAKTRPAWAADLSAYRERITDFYRREEEELRYLPGYRGMTWKQIMRMTHLERFSRLRGADAESEEWLLFDYSRRDPLTGDAAVFAVEMP